MILKSLMQQVETASHPVAKAIQKGQQFKVLAIAMKQGMELKEHKTSLPAKLTVLKGTVHYHQGDLHKVLGEYDETDIPVGILHSVECIADALCLLTQGA